MLERSSCATDAAHVRGKLRSLFQRDSMDSSAPVKETLEGTAREAAETLWKSVSLLCTLTSALAHAG